MNGATHIAMTKAVVEALSWKGDLNLVAKNADYPDRVRAIEVEKYGAYIIGKNLASLTHFVRPVDKDKYEGYCWKRDRSVPHIDLSSVKVIPKPEAWGWPYSAEMIAKEPLVVLVHDLTQPGHQGSIEADNITYSTAAIMADWHFNCYKELSSTLSGEERQKALDTVAGSIFHLAAQDPAVPHHSGGIMLDGHSSFEGEVDEEYKRMVGDGTVGTLLADLTKKEVPAGLTIRTLAEQTASRSVVSPRKLGWYRCFWRKGWNTLVRQCVIRGLEASVRVGKLLSIGD